MKQILSPAFLHQVAPKTHLQVIGVNFAWNVYFTVPIQSDCLDDQFVWMPSTELQHFTQMIWIGIFFSRKLFNDSNNWKRSISLNRHRIDHYYEQSQAKEKKKHFDNSDSHSVKKSISKNIHFTQRKVS